MSKNQITFKDGTPAPFMQPGEAVIKLNPGMPPLGSAAFEEELKAFHKKHNSPAAIEARRKAPDIQVTAAGKRLLGK